MRRMLRHWSSHHASHWILESRPCKVPGCNRLLGSDVKVPSGIPDSGWLCRFSDCWIFLGLYPMFIIYPFSDKPVVETCWVWVQSGTGLIRKEAERPTMVMSQCSNVHKLLYNMQSWFLRLWRGTCTGQHAPFFAVPKGSQKKETWNNHYH